MFAAAGLTDLFIAYPLWVAGSKAGRLRALADVAVLRIGVDSVAGARTLGTSVAGVAHPPRVLIEVDSGDERTGVPTPAEVVDVARAAADAGLHVDGVFTHGGHGYQPGRAAAAGADESRSLSAATDAMAAAGFDVRTISSGSSPTRLLAGSLVNEVRAGTVVFGDRLQASLGSIGDEDVALVVAATVVSSRQGQFVVDAGAKSLTKDRPSHLAGHGFLPAYPDAVIDRLSDYHGVVVVPDGTPSPAIGEVVAIVPNHVCPVVDLFNEFSVVNADGSIERWPVDARGRSR